MLSFALYRQKITDAVKRNVFSKAFALHEGRSLLLNPAIPVFLGFAWAMVAALIFYLGGFFLTNTAHAYLMFSYLPWVMAIAIPALTMHGWAEEWRRGTAERLLTLPIRLPALAITRFLVMWGMLGLFLLGTWPFLITLAWLGDPEWGPILTGYVGVWLLMGVQLAASLLVASLSRSFVTAFLGGFLLNIVLLLAGWSALLFLADGFLPEAFLAPLLAIQRFSLQEHLRQFVIGLFPLNSLLHFFGLMVLFLGAHLAVLQRRAEQGPAKHRGWQYLVSGIGLAIILFVMASVNNLRWDATWDKRYTLSQSTIHLLQNLPIPITLVVYDSRNNPELPPAAYNTSQALHDLLMRMQQAVPGKLFVRTISPEKSMENEMQAIDEGMLPQPLPSNENYYLGLVAQLGTVNPNGTSSGRQAYIPYLDNARIPYLEFDIATLITEAAKTRRKNLSVLSSLNLNNTDLRPRYLSELSTMYNMRMVKPGDPVIPEETDILLIVDAPFLPEESLYAVDQYLVKGGHALLLMDPAKRTALEPSTGAPDRNADELGFDHPADLLRQWGISYDWNIVVGDITRATPIQQKSVMNADTEDEPTIARLGLGITTYPFWISLNDTNVNPRLPFTSFVRDMILPEPGAIALKQRLPSLNYEPVLQSTANARIIHRTTMDQYPAQLLGGQMQGSPRQRDFAGMLTGYFPSTFDDVPESVKNYYRDYAADPAQATWPAHLAATQTPGAMIIFADSDFMSDEFALVKTPPVAGDMTGTQGRLVPRNDNLILFYNTLQYLAGDGDLLELRGKNLKSRTFSHLEALLSLRTQSYVKAEQDLAAEITRAGERLTELAVQEKQESLLQDQKRTEEINAWKSRDFALKKQLRDLRQNFRQDFVFLSQFVSLANILAMPLLVAMGYTAFRWRRRRQGRQK